MKVTIPTFRGEAPRLTARELPPTAAQEATNCRLQSGDLESWRQFTLTKTLSRTGAIQTIYKLNTQWISWNEQVDVARGVIAGDNTFRIFLTCPSLFATPRWTNFSLATTGSEPYPVTTRPLGVPEPTTKPTLVPGIDATPTSFSINITDSGGELATNWSVDVSGGGAVYENAGGYRLDTSASSALFKRNFGTKGSSFGRVTLTFLFPTGADDLSQINISLLARRGEIGASFAHLSQQFKNGSPLNLMVADESGAPPGIMDSVFAAFSNDVVYTLVAELQLNATGVMHVTAKIYDGVTLLYSLAGNNNITIGDYIHFSGANALGAPVVSIIYENIHVEASGSSNYVAILTATNYLYTFVNDLGEESAPSPASLTVLRPDGISITVTSATTAPGDPTYAVTTKRIYRTVTGASGTAFLFVAEIPLATADYVDVLDDATISNPGVLLESEDWDVPPPTLEGLLSLPNGVMAGFFRNQLCLSAAGHPHAWPVNFRLTTDTDIVAISNIDNTIVIGTKSYVYTATGNDPANYSMSRPGAAQSCTSKRGMIYLDQVGVVFPSPDGYMVCSGSAGAVRNATENIFTKRQWQALDPTSVIAGVHDGVLHFFVTGPTPDRGYAIDSKQTGFGLIRLAYHATAVHADPITDALYLALDRDDEPTDGLLPLASTKPTPTGQQIYEFDSHATNNMVFRFRGKMNFLPYPIGMQRARITCFDYANVVVRFYGDGVLLYTKLVTDGTEFAVPTDTSYSEFEIELMGTSSIQIASAAEHVEELD